MIHGGWINFESVLDQDRQTAYLDPGSNVDSLHQVITEIPPCLGYYLL